jgi:ERCC4-type nuclease
MTLTDGEIAKVLKDIVIIADTRERKNKHILDYFDKNKIKYIVRKLDSADYSFMLPNYTNLHLDEAILVEKKNSLTEIAGNFTSGRKRFTNEFDRAMPKDIHIVIEDATWKKVVNGSYRSQLPPKSMMASIMTWNARFRCPIWFVGKSESPMVIYNIIYYGLRELLK